jgi:hypothetical protein
VTKRTCQGTTKRGKPCGANPLKPGTVIQGVTVTGTWCRTHDEDLPASAKLHATRTPEQMGGRPKNPRVVDVIRERIEQNDEVTKTLLHALDAEKAVVVATRDEAHVEMVPDHQIRIQAARELLDRGYGRPHQSSDVTVVTEDRLVEAIERMEAELASNDPDRSDGQPGDTGPLQGAERASSEA